MTGFLSFLSSLPLQKLTQNENENQGNVRDQIFEDEDGGRKPDETSSALLSKERCLELLRKHNFLKNVEKHILVLTDDNGTFYSLSTYFYSSSNLHTWN